MATTAKGTPYVVSTDLVANYPTVSSDLATHIDAKLAYNAVTINAQTGTTYTFALADASEGKLVTASNAAASTYTVPPQSSVTWADGAVLRILNQGAGVVTIAAGAGVTINGTPLTLAQYKGAAIQRTASNTWTFVPFSGGVGNAVISDTPTGSYTGYNYWSYTASGTLNVTTAGFADVLIVAGGGGSGGSNTASRNGGGGGAGGYLYIADCYLPSGSLTVTVGAGGAAGVTGGDAAGEGASGSRLGSLSTAGGGGGGGAQAIIGRDGASGGGGGDNGGVAGKTLDSVRGFAGGPGGNTNNAGGGGGSGGAGGTPTGGIGTANSITGSSVTRAAGGAGGQNGATAPVAGAANTGNGATGRAGTGNGAAGGSGIVIVRVAV